LTPTKTSAGKHLKEQLATGRVIAAGAFVPFVARLAEEAGYDARERPRRPCARSRRMAKRPPPWCGLQRNGTPLLRTA